MEDIGGFDFDSAAFSDLLLASLTEEAAGRPAMTGGGNSKPSAAFRESCRAKSEACHHSRNFRANMEVGSRMLRDENNRGPTMCVIVLGLKMLVDCPGRAAASGFACVARAIALWSASPKRRIRVPTSHWKGE